MGLGVCPTTFAAKGAHSAIAMSLASEEFRSFTLPDSSEEEQEGKNVEYGHVSGLAHHSLKGK